ncbi:transcription-repair coupling factor [Oleiphilus sp. HI0125]|nr:transcription-repair coupling factor [Oleiphilus sp. HI0125]
MKNILVNSDLFSDSTSQANRIACYQNAKPYLISEIIQNKQKSLTLVITNDMQEANALVKALEFLGDGSESGKAFILPDWETLPYDNFSPHEDIISQRLSTLAALRSMQNGVLVVPVQTLLQRLPPVDFIAANSLSLQIDGRFNPDDYRRSLEQVGYRHVDTVYEHGEYAVRGSIFDVYPMGSEFPIRIELFDDEIESLRSFDPETQRSKEKLKSIELLPAHEFPWDRASRLAFRNRWLDQFDEKSFSAPILRDIKEGIKPHGIEYYAPLFFESMTSLFEYLPDSTQLIFNAGFDDTLKAVWAEINERYEDRRHDVQQPILAPHTLFLAADECFSEINKLQRIELDTNNTRSDHGFVANAKDLPDLTIDDRLDIPAFRIKEFQKDFPGKLIVISESAGRRESLQDLFKDHQIEFEHSQTWQDTCDSDSSGLSLVVGPIESGFILGDDSMAVVTETELFGQLVRQTYKRRTSAESQDNFVKSLTELRVGAPVVHIDHGVGRYKGLETISVDGMTDEFLTLEYDSGSKLYVPIASLNLISRYSGTDESLAPLHKLGTDRWSTTKQKALEKIRDTAAELLEVYAKRAAKKGFKYSHPKQAYRAFCAGFPFEETPDQAVAINAVVQDMTKDQPMDRLVCGDVGFGKTEVAMRAAFIASYSSKQVAVLVPTTLLAQQHYQSFLDRFADTAVNVELISRFKTAKEQGKVLERVESGEVDILVGTHKLIQGNIKFKNLGLLIIDEEHRFGVQQKEKLKALRAEVDILTLTATPIPRTLNMAMGGVRDLSIIATPPAKRLSVKTFVRQKQDALIRESVLREILRGGQVYYLFNDVKNIEKEVEFLQKLIPESRVGFAHGQMRERELEQAMSDFYHQRFNVLVSSTIIETGIDIPNANTIIIDRSDKFGLAQLHQLRGRVGRSHHQAYAYLLTPAEKRLTRDAEKRLEAITAAQELGSGFMLATHDLEIRGAGELLGEEQSGQIQSVGFSLYMELLEQAVQSLQDGKELNIEEAMHGTEVNLRIPALIPDDYLPDVHSRLVLYKRISSCKNNDELKDLQIEMIDRFGLLPEPSKNLLRQTELKLQAEKLGIVKVDAGATSGSLEFGKTTDIDPLTLVQLVQKSPHIYRLEGASKLRFELKATIADQKIEEIKSLLKTLAQPAHNR